MPGEETGSSSGIVAVRGARSRRSNRVTYLPIIHRGHPATAGPGGSISAGLIAFTRTNTISPLRSPARTRGGKGDVQIVCRCERSGLGMIGAPLAGSPIVARMPSP